MKNLKTAKICYNQKTGWYIPFIFVILFVHISILCQAQLSPIEDGSFESPSLNYGNFQYSSGGTTWIHSNGTGVSSNGSAFTIGNPDAPEGQQVLFLQSSGQSTTTLNLAAGMVRFQLKAAQRGNVINGGQTFEVLLNGQVLKTIKPTSIHYETFTTDFIVIAAGDHELKFLATNPEGGDNTAFVDDIQFDYTPFSLVENGGFESPSQGYGNFAYSPSGTNWTHSNGAGISSNGTAFTSGNPGAPEGGQVLFLQGSGQSTTTLSLPTGMVRFQMNTAQRGNQNNGGQTFQVLLDGQVLSTITPSGSDYEIFTTDFMAVAAGDYELKILATNPKGGDNTVFVDDVRVEITPSIENGGFEAPLQGHGNFAYNPVGTVWTHSTQSGVSSNGSAFTSGNPTAPEGNQVLFLQGSSQSTTTLKLGAGMVRFQLKAAQRSNQNAGGQTFQILLDNEVLSTITPSETNYETFTTDFKKVTAGDHELKLLGTNPEGGDNTAFVDDIQIEVFDNYWSNAVTWSPDPVPDINTDVVIPSGKTVILDTDVDVNTITVKGQLIVSQEVNLNLKAKGILVEGTGARFEWGKASSPYRKRGVIILKGAESDPDIHGHVGKKFLAAHMGGEIEIHGDDLISWTQLGANADAGGTSITLKEPVNWRVGDEIVIVSSRLNYNEAEKRTIDAISQDKKTLTLDAALDYPHKGVVKNYSEGGRNWTADLRAEVGLLTHNITIQGDAPINGFGGHIMIHHNAKAYVEGVELYNMGQKAILARYPFHWHMVGDVGAGQYFKNSSVHQSYNRGITIHGTESTLVENNFFYDHIGHGVFLEDGSERFNVIRKNVVLLTKRPAEGEELTPSDNEFNEVQNRTPSSYWITNPQNTFEDNVAAGTEGTGYWFAFPTSPMGPSATDPRFSSLQPHTLPLISFKGNTAHSCMSGFDIFDQLFSNHAIHRNAGWANNDEHLIENCLWYANDLALYAGIGGGGSTNNLKFRNNVLVENKWGVMFASNSIVEESVIVAQSGETLIDNATTRYAYILYDGPGQLINNHFVGWDAANASFLAPIGAATKHPNHKLQGNTTDANGTVRISLPNFDLPPGYAHANDPRHPRIWSNILRDVDGGIGGTPNTSIISNHPFQLVGDEHQPSNWINAYRSDHHFVLSLLNYGLSFAQIPNVVVTREKTGTSTEHVYYIDGYKEHHQLPFIVNEGFEYTYQYDTLPSSKLVRLNMMDATAGDNYIARFKDFGKLGGINLVSSQGAFPSHNSLEDLRNANSSGYYLENQGDLYIKTVATGNFQYFNITWTTNFTPTAIDTDGDEMTDAEEVVSGRHPFDADDLTAAFLTNGDFEGWDAFANITNEVVLGSVLQGTSSGNGDAFIINDSYNFDSDAVSQIIVRMKASQSSGVQLFFVTDNNPGYSQARVVSVNYTGNNSWQTIAFDMNNHNEWDDTITGLRLDVVSGANIAFEVDWISALDIIDSDGDEMTDREEDENSRDAWDANDLAAEFSNNGDFEGWDAFANITGETVSGDVLQGTSSGNGDAYIINDTYNFSSAAVPQISVRMKASQNSGVQLFFATNDNPGYSGTRMVSGNYTGNNSWQTIVFDMNGHNEWDGIVTGLRLDVVSGADIDFEIDWIHSTGEGTEGARIAHEEQQESIEMGELGLSIYPNPSQDMFNFQLVSEEEGEVSISLYDLSGRLLISSTDILNGEEVLQGSVMINTLNTGIYLVKIGLPSGKSITERIVKME